MANSELPSRRYRDLDKGGQQQTTKDSQSASNALRDWKNDRKK